MAPAIDLPSELDAALRAQLRDGEMVVYARRPFMHRDVTSLFRIGRIDLETVLPLVMAVAGTAMLISLIVDRLRGVEGPLGGASGWLLTVVFLFVGIRDVRTSLRERRTNRHTVYAVTDQRVLRITTWPTLKHAAWEATELSEITRRDIKPDCGHIRYLPGMYSHSENALMYVPAPGDCEAAMRALISRPATGNAVRP